MNASIREDIRRALDHMAKALALLETSLEHEVGVYEGTRRANLRGLHTPEKNIDALCRACLDLSSSVDCAENLLDE